MQIAHVFTPLYVLTLAFVFFACGTPKSTSQPTAHISAAAVTEPSFAPETKAKPIPDSSSADAAPPEEADTDNIGPELLAMNTTAVVLIENVAVSQQGVSAADAKAAGESTIHHQRLCYDQAMQQFPAAEGAIQLSVIIDKSGTINQVNIVTSDFGGGLMNGCVESGFYGLSIPSHAETETVEIKYTIRFSQSAVH